MKKIKRTLTVFITLILVTIFVYNVYNLINIKILKNDLSPVYGYAMLEVVSGSMEPTIHVGDMIIIDTWDTSYHKNDIVTFKDEDGALVTHRIKSIKGKKMVTKGDNNDSEDKPYTTDQIIGKYVTKISGLGRIMASFKSPITMVLILFIGVLTCVLVSTDKEGNPIVEKDDQEFLDYLKEKNKLSDKKTKADKNSKTKNSKKADNKKESTKNTNKEKVKKEESKKSSRKTSKKEDKKVEKKATTKKTATKKSNTTSTKKTKSKKDDKVEIKKTSSAKKTTTKKDGVADKTKKTSTKKKTPKKVDEVKKTSTSKAKKK